MAQLVASGRSPSHPSRRVHRLEISEKRFAPARLGSPRTGNDSRERLYAFLARACYKNPATDCRVKKSGRTVTQTSNLLYRRPPGLQGERRSARSPTEASLTGWKPAIQQSACLRY